MRSIVFTEKDTARLISIDEPVLRSGTVMVRTAVSTISNGTERANITGDPVVSISCDENSPVIFPRSSGYSSTGEVIAVGEGVEDLAVGDRVAMIWSQHRQINLMPASNVIKLPDDISYELGALCHIATFSLAAIRKTALEIGESCLVMGLGILGLCAVALARSAGAVPIVAVDVSEKRRNTALSLGADYALDPFDPDFLQKINGITGGGAKCAVEVTGLGAGLNQCLDCMAPFGRIALLGCTRNKDFTVDYYRKVHGKGVSLIGAHTLARSKTESSHGNFTVRDDMKTLIGLLHYGRLRLPQVEESHSPEECYEVYSRLIGDRDFPAVVQFDWRKL